MVTSFLSDHIPFEESQASLRKIETGVTSSSNVNVDKAKEVGCQILEDMVGKSSQTTSSSVPDKLIRWLILPP